MPIVNTTFTGNVAGAAGTGQSPGSPGDGTIANFDFAGTDLTDVTIAGNTSGGDTAINGPGGRPLVETDTIIASNTNTVAAAGLDSCNPDQVTDGGHNVAYAAAGYAGVSVDPKLGVLANNDSRPRRSRSGTGSSAIGLVPVSACALKTDQRGLHRPAGTACDAGASEVSPPVLAGLRGRRCRSGLGERERPGDRQPHRHQAQRPLRHHQRLRLDDIGHRRGLELERKAVRGDAHPGWRPSTYHVQVVATNPDGTSSAAT